MNSMCLSPYSPNSAQCSQTAITLYCFVCTPSVTMLGAVRHKGVLEIVFLIPKMYDHKDAWLKDSNLVEDRGYIHAKVRHTVATLT